MFSLTDACSSSHLCCVLRIIVPTLALSRHISFSYLYGPVTRLYKSTLSAMTSASVANPGMSVLTGTTNKCFRPHCALLDMAAIKAS